MRGSLVAAIAILTHVLWSPALAQDQAYKSYEDRPRLVTELEWRLLQVQIPLAAKEAYLSFNSSGRVFEMIVWVTTVQVRRDTSLIRAEFEATLELASALLGRHFPEFKDRGSKDLRAQLLLGRRGGEEIAVFDGSRVRFTQAYYDFLKEIGRR